jgi:hypothetical protein
VVSYFGRAVSIDNVNHFDAQVDPESGLGAFGNEYHGEMPLSRWQITKLDLLCVRAGGYALRPTSAFEPLRFASSNFFEAEMGQRFEQSLAASSGIPFYLWATAGNLPEGLSLNSFTGEIAGIPSRSGVSEFSVRVQDYADRGTSVTNVVTISVQEARLRLQIVPTQSGALVLRSSGEEGQRVDVQQSSDLLAWQTIATDLAPFDVPIQAVGKSMFYRARQGE